MYFYLHVSFLLIINITNARYNSMVADTLFIFTFIRYPQLCLYRVLQGGTLKSYTYVSFSHTGSKLASVGGAPDYILLSPYRGSTLKLSS